MVRIDGGEVSVEECSRRWKTQRGWYVHEVKKVKARKSANDAPGMYQLGRSSKSCPLLKILHGIEWKFHEMKYYAVQLPSFLYRC